MCSSILKERLCESMKRFILYLCCILWNFRSLLPPVKPGSNTIERKSTESSVTIPFERTFRNLDENRPIGGDSLEQFNFCGCGWPQHMLVPKGKEEGFPMDLFIMISDYTGDAVSTFYTYRALAALKSLQSARWWKTSFPSHLYSLSFYPTLSTAMFRYTRRRLHYSVFE